MNELWKADLEKQKLLSQYVMEQIRDEVWRLTRHDERETAAIFTAKQDLNPETSNLAQAPNKHPQNQLYSHPGPSGSCQGLSGGRGRAVCENEFCERPVGHFKAECFAYGGGAAGKYSDKYKGPRDIHLPPAERIKQ
jgi:hypothetical protein